MKDIKIVYATTANVNLQSVRLTDGAQAKWLNTARVISETEGVFHVSAWIVDPELWLTSKQLPAKWDWSKQ